MKNTLRNLALALCALITPALQAGNLKVTIAPAQAVSAGAQWRVDGGVWRNSGVTVKNLSNTTHNVDFKTVSGWIVPAPFSVVLTNGTTTTRTGTYLQSAALTLNLTPSSAQWRIAGGAWRNSGTSAIDLVPGSYTLEFSSLYGYTTPPTESITPAAGQALTLARTYPLQAQFGTTLTPGSGQWRINGGAWRASGTMALTDAGTWTIDYAPLEGYTAPAAEQFTFTPGQVLTTLRSYTPITTTLQVTLSGANGAGTWRVNGGAWRASGAVVQLDAGTWNIDYAPVAGYTTPPAEPVTLTTGQALTFSRTYAPQAQFGATLEPSSGQWRVNGGIWRASGTTTLLDAGAWTIEYAPLASHLTPPSEQVTLTAGQVLTVSRSYTLIAGTLQVMLSGGNGTGTWRVDGGAWRASGSSAVLEVGNRTIEYSTVATFTKPASETVTIVEGETLALTRSYTPMARLAIALTPYTGKWRIPGGAWINSNVLVYLDAGTHTIEYLSLAGYDAPPSEQMTLTAGVLAFISRSYAAHPGSLAITLTPEISRWRVDGGSWQTSGAVVPIAAGNHSVEYERVDFFVSPEPETVAIAPEEAKSLTRTFTAGGDLLVRSNPPRLGERGVAQWRIDGGPWRACGTRVGVLAGAHTLEFKATPGLDLPPTSTIDVASGELLEMEGDFLMPHRLRFFIKEDLAAGLSMADLQARLSQYAADLQTVFHRETARRFTFDPATAITICTADPFSWNYVGTVPELGFEMWVYARLTDNPEYGTYGGNGGLDRSGAGGAANLKWDRVYDRATLQPNTPEMMQYWRQIDHIIHEFQHSFGAGLGEYYSLGTLADPTGVAPILPTVHYSYPLPGDPFWGTRPEYWADPLLVNIYGEPRVGAPRALPDLLSTVRFAPASIGVINNLCRGDDLKSLPDLSQVKVSVVDASTGQPISGATCRVWNRRADVTPFEETVSATAIAGVFSFSWSPYPHVSVLSNYRNAHIIKAWATGYVPAAQWECLYDAQKAKLIDGQEIFEITIALSPE